MFHSSFLRQWPIGKYTSAAIALALLAVSGCSSYDAPTGYASTTWPDSSRRSSNTSSAVQASEATRAPRSDRQSGRFALAYPTGDRNTSALLTSRLGPRRYAWDTITIIKFV